MIPTATPPELALAPQVLAFAVEKGVAEFLPGVAALTRRLFSHERIDVLVEDDPELASNRQITFEVDCAEMTEEQMFAGYTNWNEQLAEHCPTTHTHVFCMALVTF